MEQSFFNNLMYRRVPHILGMYVAATWLVIELGDWVTERFNMPAALTSFVFIGMLALLPAVIMFSYNHGAPGRDRWSTTEKFFIPANLAVAVALLYVISPQLTVEAATQSLEIADETGVVQQFEVARPDRHQDVIGFFLENESDDEESEWLSYGLGLLLAHDMNRVSPAITVVTPFLNWFAKNELVNRGYPSLLDEPQALQVQIARERNSAALIVGGYSLEGDTLNLKASVIDAETGETIGSHTASGTDWLTLIDDVSFALLEYLDVRPAANHSNDPVSQHFSESLEAIEHYTKGEVAIKIHNDYETGINEYQRAMEIDPAFAEAIGQLALAHYLSGDVDSARATVPLAMKNGYRLSQTSKFRLRANGYAFNGQYDRAERVLEMWTEVEPTSTSALRHLARITQIRGGAEGLAKSSAALDRLLELKPNDYDIYRQQSTVAQQRGDYEAATAHLRTYLDYQPDSGDTYLQLAGLYQAQGNLEAAQGALEDAAALSDDLVSSELGLARLQARRGLFKEAEVRVARQLNDSLSPQKRAEVLGVQSELAQATGQIARAFALMQEIDEVQKAFMPPMVRMLSTRSPQVIMLLLQGKSEEAIALTDEVAAQLQPPLNAYMYFSYTQIYAQLDNREKFREYAEKSRAARANMPVIFAPFVEMESALLAIWDEDFDAAINHLDNAKNLLDQSLLTVVMQDNLVTYEVQVQLAELYLMANALEKGEELLEKVLKVYPKYATAKLVFAKLLHAKGETDAARAALDEAFEIWQDADENYLRLVEAKTLQQSL